MTNVLMSQLVEGDDINSRLGAARKEGIVQLAASIKEVGLILPLAVRRLNGPLSADAADEERFEIVDGHRRFAALKKLKWSEPVPVNVITGDARAQSLIANVERLPLHPVDQFEALRRLTDEGWSTDRIMKAFNLTDLQVRRILRLAGMSDKVRAAWKKGDLQRGEAEAFAVSTDHKTQDAALKEVLKAQYRPAPYEIKRLVTGGARAVGKAMEFVGIDRYTAAGGQVLEDLFAEKEDHRFLVSDNELLTKLVNQKVLELITDLNAEGIEVHAGYDTEVYEYEDLLDPPEWNADAQPDPVAYLRSLPKEKLGGAGWILEWTYLGVSIDGPFKITEYRDAEPGAADEDDATDEGYVAPAPREPVEAKEPDGYTAALRQDMLGWRTDAYQKAFSGQGAAMLRVMISHAQHALYGAFNPSLTTGGGQIDVWQYGSALVLADEMALRYAPGINAREDHGAKKLAVLLADTPRLATMLHNTFIAHAEEYFERCNMTTIRKDLADMGADALGNDAKKSALAKYAAKKAIEKAWLPALLRVGLDDAKPRRHSTDPAMNDALAEDAAYLEAMGQNPGPTLDDLEAEALMAASAEYDHADLA